MAAGSFAVISSADADLTRAAALARFLETFGLPVAVGGPQRREAVRDAGALIVLCSPAAAASVRVDEEIRAFRSGDARARVFAVLLAGDPAVAVPPALLDAGSAPPVADLRVTGSALRDERLRLVAALLGVEFDALKRRDAARRRVARLRAGLVSTAIAACFVLGLVALVGLVRAQTMAAANQVAALSGQTAADDVVGMLLAAEAFGAAQTPQTAGALLRHIGPLASYHRNAGAALSDVSAVADRGRDLVTVDGDEKHADVVVYDASDLRRKAGAVPVDPNTAAVCAFDDAPLAAVAETHDVRTLRLNAEPPVLDPPIALAKVTVLACLPHGTLALGTDPARVATFDLATGAHTVRASLAGGTLVGLTASPTGRYLAALVQPSMDSGDPYVSLAQLVLFDLRTGRRRVVARLSLPSSCLDTRTCGTTVAFAPDESSIAWRDSDAPAIWLASVSGAAVKRRLPCPACDDFTALPASAVVTFRAGASTPEIVYSTIVLAFDAHAKRYVASRTYPGDPPPPQGGSEPDDSPFEGDPVFDPRSGTFAEEHVDPVADTSVVVQQALSGVTYPLLGLDRAPAGSLVGAHALVAWTASGPQRVEFARFPAVAAAHAPAPQTLRVRDAGDGRHGVVVNAQTGRVEIEDLAQGDTPVAAFALPAGLAAGLTDDALGYDPATDRVVIADAAGVTRYAPDGTVTSRLSWREIMTPFVACQRSTSYGIGDVPGAGAFALSARGGYLTIRSSGGSVLMALAPQPRCLPLQNAAWLVSDDERYAFQSIDREFADPDHPDTTMPEGNLPATIYALPNANQVSRARLPIGSLVAAVTHDGRRIAYVNRAGRIQLLDAVTQLAIGPPLPLPPEHSTANGGYTSLRFSGDDRFLVFEDEIPAGDDVVRRIGVYDVDPARWLRWVCIAAGRSLAPSERAQLEPLAYRDTCGTLLANP